MSMKKFLLTAALLSGIIVSVSAQDSRQMPDPEVRSQRQTEAISKRLSLSAEQQAKVRGYYLEQARAVDSIRSAANGNFQGLRGKIQPLQEATEQKIMAILDTEQKKQFEKFLEERQSRMQGARRGNNRK
mgnify:CR=1 FL=1